MGERRNPNCNVRLVGSQFDRTVAEALGIDLSKAMFGAIARTYSKGAECQQMTHAVIAHDEETYDAIVALGEELKLPLPQEMIADAQAHQSARSRAKELNLRLDANAKVEGAGTFSACCSRSKDVTVLLVGEVKVNGKPPTDIRYAVADGLVVRVETDPTKPGPSGLPSITAAEISYLDNFKTCREGGE